LGVFDEREEYQPDTLNKFEDWWVTPVQVVLLLFGFANARVPFTQMGAATHYVLAGLLLGKPKGILAFSGMARFAGAPAAGPATKRSVG
jgi:Na+/H+ antiporter NhaA